MNDNKLIQGIEAKLRELNLGAAEEMTRRQAMHQGLGLKQSGFISKDLRLEEGSILIGVSKGELKQAIARDGMLWVDGEGFLAVSAAAIKATGNPTMSGWEFWKKAWIPGTGKGFVDLTELRITEPRKNGKRKSEER
jgi:hypothetical protein